MRRSVISHLTTWALRILLFLVIAIGACLLMLSSMGGTSESHRVGLEQAFSDSLNADIKLGRIDEFNIMPQLTMRAANIQGKFRDTKNEFMIDALKISFGFTDLMTGRRRIEDFQIDNFRFAQDAAYDFRLDHAGFAKTSPAAFAAKGQYDKKEFDLSMGVRQEAGPRPSYSFADRNDFHATYGSLSAAGQIAPATGKNAQIFENIKLSANGVQIGDGHGVRDGKGPYRISFSCRSGAAISAPTRSDMASLAKLKFFMFSDACLK